jgi:hypothetical protein
MKKHAARESGAALIVAMMLLLVLAIMLIGFYFATAGEQKVAVSNRDNEITYYWAVAGLEQMSNLIADFFAYTAAPTPTSIINWATASSNFKPYPVTIPTSGLPLVTASYTLYCMVPPPPGPCTTVPAFVLCSTVSGSSLGNCNGSIGGNGPLAGLEGVITPLLLQVTADGPSNTEVKLNRVVQEVAVPIFEFGIFSDNDLSFHAGADFNFGGRVHTNGNLYLAEDGGSTLNMNDHVSAAKSIIRDQLSNGYTMATYPSTTCQYSGAYCAYVNVLTTANGCPSTLTGLQTGNGCLTLQVDQGSIEQGPGSTENPNWATLSKTTYSYFIQDGTTGGQVLNLAISLPGISSQPIAMIQRPPSGESATSALGMARFYNQASLRILLSDSQSDIMALPGIDSTEQPYPLAELNSSGLPYTVARNTTIPATYCPTQSNCTLPPIDACHPPLAESVGASNNSNYMTGTGTTLLGGYIKIEMNLASSPGTWKDVTEEILAQGISRDIATTQAQTAPAATLAKASGGNLGASTTYYYVVTAVGPWGESAGTVASITTGSSHKTITLTWTAVTGATGYNVYRTTTSGTYTGSGNGVINLVVGTAQGTSWVSPYSPTATFTDSGAISPASSPGPPSPCSVNNSIIHLEEAAPGITWGSSWTSSGLSNVSNPQSFVPINMYDAREGEVRDSSTATTPSLNGIMNLVEVDVHNLQQWFAGNIATSGVYAYNGPDALDNAGYILYTSDRRMDCNDSTDDNGTACTGTNTGMFGNEDIINPANSNGAPNGVLDAPEDVVGDGVFRTYGAYSHPIAAPSTTVSPTGTSPSGETWSALINSLSSSTNNPTFVRITSTQAQDNSVVIFRRALRLVNGTLGNLPPLAAAQATTCSGGTAGGFSVASENPVYVMGDYNASVANGFNDAAPLCHVPASVMGDAVTLLSNNWTAGAQSGFSSGDADSFANPASSSQRTATSTYYRMAVMAGKVIPFPQPSWSVSAGVNDTGTDGGVHNFLRYDEDWNNQTLNYLGSLASFYYSRQATGIYKYGYKNTVYQPPTRNYTFDTDFQSISKLPPGTPRFTDVNALSYYQSTLPNQ